jgi:SAM-dependent methyltransferase
VDLRAAWEKNAPGFIAWARKPGHDSYWRFHREAFFELLPAPGERTLDLGCGEGRVSRDLTALGHHVVGVDASRTMIDAARSASVEFACVHADAARIPLRNASFDLVIAFMSLQDVEAFEAAIAEAARVLQPGGRLCLAIVHPFGSAGSFEGEQADSPFVVRGSYLDRFYYQDDLARGGIELTIVSAHRPLHAYVDALADAGFVIERLAERAVPEGSFEHEHSRRWQRLPLFLHVRAVKR